MEDHIKNIKTKQSIQIQEKKGVALSQDTNLNTLEISKEFPVPAPFNENVIKVSNPILSLNHKKMDLTELENKVNKLTLSKSLKPNNESDSEIVRNIKSLFPEEHEKILIDPSNIWPLLIFLASCIFCFKILNIISNELIYYKVFKISNIIYTDKLGVTELD